MKLKDIQLCFSNKVENDIGKGSHYLRNGITTRNNSDPFWVGGDNHVKYKHYDGLFGSRNFWKSTIDDVLESFEKLDQPTDTTSTESYIPEGEINSIEAQLRELKVID